MGSSSEIEDDFSDAHDVFVSTSDSDSEPSSDDCSTSGFNYESWIGNLDSVDERRNRFLRSVGLSRKWLARDEETESKNKDFHGDSDEINQTTEKPEFTVQQNPVFEDDILIRQPSLSCWSNLAIELPSSSSVSENPQSRDESDQETSMKRSFEFGSSSKHSSRKESNNVSLFNRRSKLKKGWLQKLNIMARSNDYQEEEEASLTGMNCSRAVQVNIIKKKSKELSSLYATQNFPAHNGSISILKFSHDGRYLASAGEDGIVRIWEITESDDPRKYEIHGNDRSLYFSANHLSELAPIKGKNRKIKKSSEVACVILPPKVFRILENPVHEYHGHGGEILSLSWSNNGYLLSSSVDKTVRMWKVGHGECLKVFTHNNYVTSVEFNPVDDNYFISGSIDGKVRIWEVQCRQVIDWIEIRDIVTAVCYNAEGKGCIVGTLDGNCIFYDIIDKRLHLDAQISVTSKKKWPRRITGFQLCPADSRKVIVSSADSQVRVVCGVNVVGKFKGNRSSGSQMLASFTSDGKHIISTGDDSNIYIWNHITSDKLDTKPKSNLSTESFFSHDTSVVVPWCGIKSIAAAFPSPRLLTDTTDIPPRSTIDSPRIPTLSISRSFLDSLLKSPPTWPSETLPDSAQVSVSPSMRKSEYRFLRSAYQNTFVAPHAWGLVIVAAGFDGRITTYVNYGLPVWM